MSRSHPNRSLWLFAALGASASALVMQACSGNFTACTDTLTCSPSASGAGGTGGSDGGAAGVPGGSAGMVGVSGSPDQSMGGAAGESPAAAGAAGESGATGAPSTTCDPDHPCNSGQGPCTADKDCATSLVCGMGDGPKFGIDGNVCVPKHCTNNVTDGGETTQDCGGGCGCATFEVLSDYSSCGYDTNQDGTVVVGYENQTTILSQAMRWTGKGAQVALPFLVSSDPGNATANAVDADGNTVVGFATPAPHSTNYHVVSWAAIQWNLSDLGALPGPTTTGAAHGISNDGKVVVGKSGEGAISSHQAFTWSQQKGYTLLAGAQGDPSLQYSAALGISGDSSVIVGAASDPTGVAVPVKWTQSGTMAALGKLSGGGSGLGFAAAASSDGSVIVGNITGPSGQEAFRWTAQGMLGLGIFPGGDSSMANDVSGDGRRVVGMGTSSANPMGEAFFWDEAGGLRTLKDAMKEHGFEDPLTNWILDNAYAISANGKVVVGCAINSTGSLGLSQAFRVRLEP